VTRKIVDFGLQDYIYDSKNVSRPDPSSVSQ